MAGLPGSAPRIWRFENIQYHINIYCNDVLLVTQDIRSGSNANCQAVWDRSYIAFTLEVHGALSATDLFYYKPSKHDMLRLS